MDKCFIEKQSKTMEKEMLTDMFVICLLLNIVFGRLCMLKHEFVYLATFRNLIIKHSCLENLLRKPDVTQLEN